MEKAPVVHTTNSCAFCWFLKEKKNHKMNWSAETYITAVPALITIWRHRLQPYILYASKEEKKIQRCSGKKKNNFEVSHSMFTARSEGVNGEWVGEYIGSYRQVHPGCTCDPCQPAAGTRRPKHIFDAAAKLNYINERGITQGPGRGD